MASVAPGIPSVRVADTSERPGALRRLGLDAPRPVVWASDLVEAVPPWSPATVLAPILEAP